MIREFYIDGSCNNKPGYKTGGVGVVEILNGEVINKYSYGPYKKVTSARMEVMGLFHVMRSLSEPSEEVKIYCDNQYVTKTITDNWLYEWIFNYKHCGIERKHIDLWVDIHSNLLKLREIDTVIKMIWVRGHNGNEYNEMADRLANIGRLRE